MTQDTDCQSWYERSLPKPPVPSLDATLDRYLEYAAVVAAGQNRSLHKTHENVEKFRKEGKKFQEQLHVLAEQKKNWINDFWLSEMYLRVRLPLPVNSSPAYIFPQKKFANEEERLKYTALLVQGIVEFKDNIDKKRIPREMSTGKEKVHLCMEQYERILNCYREPGLEEDVQIKRPKSDKGNEHILVMCHDQAYVIFTRWAGRLLPFADIIHQLREVARTSKIRRGVSISVAGGSAGDRTVAAKFWDEMKTVDTNLVSLNWAKTALFVVCLDEVDHKESDLVSRGKHILTGGGSRQNGFNRWYDATIQVVVSNNGTSGLCIEHSTAEGIVIIHMAETALRHVDKHWDQKLIAQEERLFSPKPLTWHVSNVAQKLIEEQRKTFDEHNNELDLEVLVFDEFGKNFMKKSGVSPDGFVQLAMQLAHFRLHGYLVSTYESATLRRFGEGRVDNIRANTQEALEWTTAMGQKETSKEQKLHLFRKAAEKQAKVTMENVTGYGIDNHLCALSVLARNSNIQMPSIFTDPLYEDVMRFPLSTSQVTTSPDINDTYLCYGAVVRDGYGCAYNLQNEKVIFAPSAFKSNPRTNLKKFKEELREAMREMKNLLT